MEQISSWIKNIFLSWGVAPEYVKWVVIGVSIIILAIIAIITYAIVHHIIAKGIKRLVSKTSAKWDDVFFNDKLLSAASHILPPVLILMLVPYVFYEYSSVLVITEKALLVYIVVMSVHLVNVFLSSVYRVSEYSKSLKGHPLKGLTQMLKLLSICIGLIIIISLLIDRNPLIILSGLGASAAILMLVFKDSIMGLVAGIQLATNDMLKPGDWIEAPKYGVNGTVEDVSLTTVKVRNWDMTIVTVPPYLLVSDSFQNWKGMQSSGGRRVKRWINIDINTISFVTDEQLAHYATQQWYQGFKPFGQVVNLQLFRHYTNWYLNNHPLVNHEMLSMVRQLQPTEQGVPVELYFFTATTVWVEYEDIQAQIIEHIIAVIDDFGLKLFQSPTGLDLKSIK